MSRRGVLPWLSFAMLPSLAMAAWDVDTLMKTLARQEGGRARFVETKTIALLDKPVVSSGELVYRPPSHLEKRTLKPRPELLVLEGDVLQLERGKHKFSVRLSEQPEALAFVDSLRGTLAGDKAALEKSYKLKLDGTEQRWTLDLLPNDQRIASFVLRITFGGTRDKVEWIRWLQADGDSAEMVIQPVASTESKSGK